MDFDKLLRAHRRDKAGRKGGKKRKRKRSEMQEEPRQELLGGDEFPTSKKSNTALSTLHKPSGPSSKSNFSSSTDKASREKRALEYSSQFSGSRFDVHQSRLTKADRSWQNKFMFTKDWHTRHIAYWSRHLAPFVNKPCNYLEIGCFEGLSTVWMICNVLTNPSSKLTVCDTFCGVQGQSDVAETTHVTSQTRQRFDANIKECGGNARDIKLFATMSCNMFCQLLSLERSSHVSGRSSNNTCRPEFDLIYVDGSHVARDVLLDAVCGFALLRPGGIMMFDDYQWKLLPEEYNCPGLGIDVFRSCFQAHLEIVHQGYQFFCRKITSAPLAIGPARELSCTAGASSSEQSRPTTVFSTWTQCFDECTKSDGEYQVLQLGEISSNLSSWLNQNKNTNTTVTCCATSATNKSDNVLDSSAVPSFMDADTFLSRMSVENKFSAKFDFLVLGDVGGDAATCLRALVIAWGLLRIGGKMVAPRPMTMGMQLAVDGLCDCYEPHVRPTKLNNLRHMMIMRKHAGPDIVGLEKNV